MVSSEWYTCTVSVLLIAFGLDSSTMLKALFRAVKGPVSPRVTSWDHHGRGTETCRHRYKQLP